MSNANPNVIADAQAASESMSPEDRQRIMAYAAFMAGYEMLAAVVHKDNVAKGFWPEDKTSRNVGEALMLAVSELAEGMEAHRKDLNDDHLPQYKGLPVEIADAIIRLMDLGTGFGLPVARAVVDKLEYNRKRPFKHGKKY